MSSAIDFVGRNRVRRTLDEGRIVEMVNGSRWEIMEAEARRQVSSWGPVDVWITADRFGSGEFILATGDENAAVQARFVDSTED